MNVSLKHAVFVACIAFLAYSNNLGHDWAYDDHDYIVGNEFVKDPGHVGDIFTTTYIYGANGLRTGLYRPLTVLSYALNNAAAGMNPSAFHLVNDVIHSLNSVLAYYLVAAVPGGSGMALPAAVLFALHPVHTEAVDNVVGRAELLAFFFMMLSLYLYLVRERNRWLLYPLSLLSFLAALMSKETPAVLPLVVLMQVAGRRVRGGRGAVRRDFAEAVGFLCVLALYLAVRHTVVSRCGPVPPVAMHDNPLAGLSFMERLPTGLAVLGKYLLLLLVPVKLSADYSYSQIPVLGSLLEGPAVFGLLAVFGMIAASWAARKSPLVYTGILLFGMPFVVVSNIFFPIGTIMGERLLYIPSFGFTILFAWLTVRFLCDVVRRPGFVLPVVSAVCILYAGRTFARNRDWKDNETIFTRTAQTSPNSVKTAYNFALVLKNQGKLAEAVEQYRRAVAIWPGHHSAWYNLGNTLSRLKRYDEAVEAYEEALKIVPDDTAALHNLALTYRNKGEPEKAVEVFQRILELRPGDDSVRMNIGATWAGSGRYDEALKVFGEIVRNDPGNVGALVNMGNIYMIQGDSLRAETLYGRALKTAPLDRNANNAMLGLLISQDRLREAEEMVRRMKTNNIPVRRRFLNSLREKRIN